MQNYELILVFETEEAIFVNNFLFVLAIRAARNEARKKQTLWKEERDMN